MVMRAVIGCDEACDQALGRIFGADLKEGAERLADFLEGLGVSTDAASHGVANTQWQTMIEDALAGERGRNFIGRRDVLLAGNPPMRRAASG